MSNGSHSDSNSSRFGGRVSSAVSNVEHGVSKNLKYSQRSRARSAASFDRNCNGSRISSAPSNENDGCVERMVIRRPRRGSSASVGSYEKFQKEEYTEKSNKEKFPTQGEFIKNGKRYFRIVTHDHVRDILIPSQTRNIQANLMDYGEYSNIRQLISAKQTEEQVQKSKEEEKERQKMKEESFKRKQEMQKYKTVTYVDPAILEKEREANITAKMVRERAIKALQEQDDDMKKFNSLILGSKCNAIRDAQIEEKKMIEIAIEKEEKRQYELMEEARQRGLKELEERKQAAGAARQKFIKQLRDQVRANHEARILEAERLMEERLLESEAFILGTKDNSEKDQKKEEKRKKLKEEMNKLNLYMKGLCERNKHEERILDQQIHEYTKKKLEEAKIREEEKQLARLERERFIIKMRERQRELATNQQLKHEMRVLKTQNEVEKQWRIKEREIEERRQRQSQELREERDKQIQERLKVQAIELELEKKEFTKTKAEIFLFKESQKQEISLKNKAKIELRKSLLEQMNEKEKQKNMEREKEKQAVLDNLMKINYNETIKKQIMMDKINEIKSHNVPAKYVNAVERSCLQTKPF